MQKHKQFSSYVRNHTALAIGTMCAVGSLSYAGISLAQPPTGTGGAEAAGRRGPPVEATAACKSLASAQVCTFEAPLGAVSGTCIAREGMPLACRPNDARTKGSQKPPAKG
jgi:hypothetical protein